METKYGRSHNGTIDSEIYEFAFLDQCNHAFAGKASGYECGQKAYNQRYRRNFGLASCAGTQKLLAVQNGLAEYWRYDHEKGELCKVLAAVAQQQAGGYC